MKEGKAIFPSCSRSLAWVMHNERKEGGTSSSCPKSVAWAMHEEREEMYPARSKQSV